MLNMKPYLEESVWGKCGRWDGGMEKEKEKGRKERAG
jgi:hypothetical protein